MGLGDFSLEALSSFAKRSRKTRKSRGFFFSSSPTSYSEETLPYIFIFPQKSAIISVFLTASMKYCA